MLGRLQRLLARTPPQPHGARSNHTAAALIIGNEVLTGKVSDENTPALARLLFDCGIDLVRVETITDDVDDIAISVKRLSQRVGPAGYVFTSGGIGPTHDDVTYEGIAKAFGRKLVLHDATYTLMQQYFQQQKGKPAAPVLNDAAKRMAILPEGCKTLSTPGLWVPLVVVENVYVLPGIPWLFKRMVHNLRPELSRDRLPIVRVEIFTEQAESEIADALTHAQKQFPHVGIGSYPRTKDDQQYKVKVTFEGRDRDAVSRAVELVSGRITVTKRTEYTPEDTASASASSHAAAATTGPKTKL